LGELTFMAGIQNIYSIECNYKIHAIEYIEKVHSIECIVARQSNKAGGLVILMGVLNAALSGPKHTNLEHAPSYGKWLFTWFRLPFEAEIENRLR